MDNNKLTTKEYWIDTSIEPELKCHDEGHGIDLFIEKFVKTTNTDTCLEIGSYPGPHLATLGKLGYTLNGIDYHPFNATKVPMWLKSMGYKVGSFVEKDFFDFTTNEQFDVVCSFGFIEHFENFEEIILKHSKFVKPSGMLIITTPNFKGTVQNWLHRKFDKENLAVHNVSSMNPNLWASLLIENKFEIKYKGNFGGFWFWHSPQKNNWIKKKILWVIERVVNYSRIYLKIKSDSTAAYCGIVAIKK